jgi:hypothetical protein
LAAPPILAMTDLDNFYLQMEEPVKSVLLALRSIILKHDKEITESWKYRMPFFCYRGKMFCYLWIQRKDGRPYLGIVDGKTIDHPKLQQGKRARMKILLVDPGKDLPIRTIKTILNAALNGNSKNIR